VLSAACGLVYRHAADRAHPATPRPVKLEDAPSLGPLVFCRAVEPFDGEVNGDGVVRDAVGRPPHRPSATDKLRHGLEAIEFADGDLLGHLLSGEVDRQCQAPSPHEAGT
jgi:hypothetical protein